MLKVNFIQSIKFSTCNISLERFIIFLRSPIRDVSKYLPPSCYYRRFYLNGQYYTPNQFVCNVIFCVLVNGYLTPILPGRGYRVFVICISIRPKHELITLLIKKNGGDKFNSKRILNA